VNIGKRESMRIEMRGSATSAARVIGGARRFRAA